MCLAQGQQRSDAGEARTPGTSVSSQALYHCATALPQTSIIRYMNASLASKYCVPFWDHCDLDLWHMVAHILPTDAPSTQGVGSKGQTIHFSESSHVVYQIKAEDAGSNLVANILPTDTLLTQGMGSKGQTIFFTESSHVAYQIKGN